LTGPSTGSPSGPGGTPGGCLAAWRRTLGAPVDAASVAAFRIAFGLLMAASTARFVANGWVDRFFGERHTFLPYPGLEGIAPPSPEVMLGVYIIAGVAALGVALGAAYRWSAAAFFVAFSWAELTDVTNYLNHYVLVSLLAALLVVMPLGGTWSVDAWLRPAVRRSHVPRWVLWTLRFQFAVVYLYAGLAKLEGDWLLHGQPLGIWLAARDDFPVLGAWFRVGWVPVAMSWAGCLHDLLVVPALLWRRTRALAFAVLVVFHALTGALFNIGIFPVLMPLGATLFFDPDWPRRWLPGTLGRAADRGEARYAGYGRPLSRWGLGALAVYVAVQVLVPLRSHLYPGSVLWHEQGMRWSWRVMLREKSGSVTYRVRAAGWSREKELSPSRYLTPYQEREMSGQPDLIVQLARRIARDLEAGGARDVEVRADALVSLNGRPAARLVDPEVDLTRVSLLDPAPASWILPPPEGPPLPSAGVRRHRRAEASPR